MDVGTLLQSNTVVLGMILSSVMKSLVGETQKSLLCLLLLMGYHFDDRNIFSSLMIADDRFPLEELTIVKKPVEENKDAGETEDTDSDDDDGEEDDGDGDDGSDYEGEDSDDDDAEANDDSDSDSDEDDDDEEDNDEDDDNDDDEDGDDDDDDDDDDEEEHKGPPSKRKK